MSSRRLEKVSKVIQATISDVIRDGLADPRVKGLISVTRVDVSPDLRNAKIYLSILGVDEKQQQLSLMGINHANGFIRSHLAKKMTMKTCPALIFYLYQKKKWALIPETHFSHPKNKVSTYSPIMPPPE